ncbi:hypothetical protein L2E82_11442 [Cichorium intybus]|uniref:Uncharacterized protein n=1 Tax=Cichorium intybus TaxID=13427 RepID=A0ACB9GDI2_CICIN|nr:hypothetical protein L2E82_11442 [Cichorium intybus]
MLRLYTRLLGLPAHQYLGRSWISYGLNLALARKGVIVNEKVFKNLTTFELQKRGATIQDSLSGIRVYIKGNLLVTTHISSVSDIFIHDGAIGSCPLINAKIRVISDNPSALFTFHKILFQTPSCAVSHDSCPLTIYIASSISLSALDALGLGSELNNGIIAADADLSSLFLFNKAFCDENENTIKGCLKNTVTNNRGVIMSSHGVSTLFQTTNLENEFLSKFQAAIVLATSDSSSGVIPTISKLSHGQAAYHFLAGYKNGTFNPAYGISSYFYDPLQITKALFSKLVDNQIPSFLINVNQSEKQISGMDFVNLVESTQNKNIPPFKCKGGDLPRRYNKFLANKFGNLPQEFSF